ncbi:hypothetical protein B0H14DRAFT_2650964 [Mycena olivaceomarginata]|nr:hypothetical protein B0H14DRAFT_2650964 [Mycena olivaceomarginata]
MGGESGGMSSAKTAKSIGENVTMRQMPHSWRVAIFGAAYIPTIEQGGPALLTCFSNFGAAYIPTIEQGGPALLTYLDLGEPIVCTEYDLEEALKHENAARLAREDSGSAYDNDESIELEDAAAETTPFSSARTTTAMAPAHTRNAKKNQKQRLRQCKRRKAATVQALNSTTPPVPTARVLEKAAQSAPIHASFSASDFRATKQRWTGMPQPLDHPLLTHAHEPEVLKQHMRYINWQGRRIIGVLINPPVPGQQWAEVVEAATATMRTAWEKMMFPTGTYHHCRATGDGFHAAAHGFAFGGGRQEVGNIKASSQTNAAAMVELMEDPSIGRMATYPIPLFQALCYLIFSDYHKAKQALLRKNPRLHCT